MTMRKNIVIKQFSKPRKTRYFIEISTKIKVQFKLYSLVYSQIEAPADVPTDKEAKSEMKMLSFLYDCVGRIFRC